MHGEAPYGREGSAIGEVDREHVKVGVDRRQIDVRIAVMSATVVCNVVVLSNGDIDQCRLAIGVARVRER